MLYENLRNMKKCRCCLTYDCFKDMNSEYYKAGRTEIYCKILLETFDVQITNFKEFKSLICEECITKLREAADFKKQVMHAEEAFRQELNNLSSIESSANIEKQNEQDASDNLEVCNVLENKMREDSFSEYEDPYCNNEIQGEGQNSAIVTNLNHSGKTEDNSSSKIIHSDANEEETKIQELNDIKFNDYIVTTKTVKRKRLEKINSKTKCETKQAKSSRNQRENTIKLLLNSNICLFTSYKTKFGCYFCKERFLSMKTLREHTKTHSDEQYVVSSVNHLRGLSCKNVDISNLACNICEQACQDLSELQTHLTVSHNVEFTGIEHFLTPYKLENGLHCVICRQSFHTFLRLSMHMNSHSTNNVCEICGVSYINRISLRLHVHALHKEKKCKLCPTTFLTNSTKTKHMKRVHGVGDYKRYCLLCEKTFRYTYMLVEHNIKEHGAKRIISECLECGKKFPSQANLKVHMRAVHMKERNYPCAVCDMRFFTKSDKKRHERTHEDVRSFSCVHCDAKLKTKDSWRRHINRQHSNLPLA